MTEPKEMFFMLEGRVIIIERFEDETDPEFAERSSFILWFRNDPKRFKYAKLLSYHHTNMMFKGCLYDAKINETVTKLRMAIRERKESKLILTDKEIEYIREYNSKAPEIKMEEYIPPPKTAAPVISNKKSKTRSQNRSTESLMYGPNNKSEDGCFIAGSKTTSQLMYFSSSKDGVPPGKGPKEILGPNDSFPELEQFPNWRKVLSNFYYAPFKLDGLTWATVEHFYQASKFRMNNPEFYYLFSIEGNSQASMNAKIAKRAGGKSGKLKDGTLLRPDHIKIDPDFFPERNVKTMEVAMAAKFTQNPDLGQILLFTKNASLTHWTRGQSQHRVVELEKIRELLCRGVLQNFDSTISGLAEPFNQAPITQNPIPEQYNGSSCDVSADGQVTIACVKKPIMVKDPRYKDVPGGINLKKWMDTSLFPNNLYVGRGGRVPIDGKERFGYPGSKWANSYPVGEPDDEGNMPPGKYTLEESLRLYRQDIVNSDLKNQLHELKGKTLGCFCQHKENCIDCHAKVLVDLYNTYVLNIPSTYDPQENEPLYDDSNVGDLPPLTSELKKYQGYKLSIFTIPSPEYASKITMDDLVKAHQENIEGVEKTFEMPITDNFDQLNNQLVTTIEMPYEMLEILSSKTKMDIFQSIYYINSLNPKTEDGRFIQNFLIQKEL